MPTKWFTSRHLRASANKRYATLKAEIEAITSPCSKEGVEQDMAARIAAATAKFEAGWRADTRASFDHEPPADFTNAMGAFIGPWFKALAAERKKKGCS